MTDASLPLQRALKAGIEADPVLLGLVAGRIYDDVPPNAQKPYLSFGPVTVEPDDGQDMDGADARFQLDGWSAEASSREIKTIGAALTDLLSSFDDDADLSVDDERLVISEIEQVRYLKEPDGLTHHLAIVFRARTEPTA